MTASCFSFRRAVPIALLLALAFALGGCLAPISMENFRAPRIPVQYNSVAPEPLKPGTSYSIGGKPGQGVESDLYFAEAVKFVGAALASRELFAAPRANRAQINIEIAYGMRPPAGGSPRPRNSGSPTGQELEKYLYLFARESPFAIAANAEPKTLWSIQLSIIDDSNDLRKYLAILAAASIDQLGKESFGPRTFLIGENDRAVDFVRQGPP